jgi:glutathione S-transferase
MPASDSLVLWVDALFISPYAFSSFVALKEKELLFELRLVPLHEKAQHAADYRDRSLTSRVPTLAHGEFQLSESSAIDEYLEEVFPPPTYAPIYPRDPKTRARIRQVQAWIRSDLMPLREERSANTLFYERADTPLSPDGRAAADKLIRVVDRLLPRDAQHLTGDWCIADSELAFMLHRLILNGDSLPDRLRLYAERQWQRPSVREWVERARPSYAPY